MKNKLCVLLITLTLLVSFTQTARAAVTFTITPTAISNTYTGTITLQIGGLTNTETVIIQKYLDLNTNGVVDAGDILWQQFQLTDGSTSVFHDGGTAVTNFNVPGDTDGSANGSITAKLYPSQDFAQLVVGKYLFVLLSPQGHFLPQTNSFSVTNFSFAQSLTGNVVSNVTPIPNAVVFLFQPSGGGLGLHPPQGGVVANNSGGYAIKAPPGTYLLAATKTNFVANLIASPYVMLNAGATITTNIPVANATESISGKVADINDPGTRLPAMLIPLQSTNQLFTIALTDTNGNFTGRVTPSLWKVQSDDQNIDLYGYVRSQNNTNVDTSTGDVSGVSLYLSKATAIFYGTVRDNLGNPLTGIDIYAYDNNGSYEADGYSYTNGNYIVGALAGGGEQWQVQVSLIGNPTNYVFSQASSSMMFVYGQAYQYNFTAFPATNLITGRVQDDIGNPISGVGVSAINDVGYQSSTVYTDNNGNYSLNVINGNWSISLDCNDGENSLDSILGVGKYQCPNSQNATITDSNGTADFVVWPSSGSGLIFGYVKDTSGVPVAGAPVYASDGIGDNFTNSTDGSGYYSFSVTNGPWDVSVDCGVLNSLGYQCVGDQITNVSSDFVEVDFAVPIQLPLTVLHNFTALDPTYGTNSDGANPQAGLILSGSILYGTAAYGGAYGNGTVFAVNTNTLGFPTLHSFSAGNTNLSGIYTNSDGAFPTAGLILSGNILYGMAQYGGTNGNGTVFAANTNGTGFTALHTFTAASTNSSGLLTNRDGVNPTAGLILSGSTLYGTAFSGGTNGNGTVFAVNTNGTGFTSLHIFTVGNTNSTGIYTNSDGANPQAGLILSGSILYGTAAYGGTNGNGTVFAVNTNGTGFIVLHSFTALDPTYYTNSDGANPVAGLILSGNTLYGTASAGGNNYGTVFAVNTNGSGFTTLHNFSYNDGAYPAAGLILSGQTLYGTTSGGGSGFGLVFAVNVSGAGFASLYGFTDGSDGADPLAGLVLSANILYGTSFNGGINDDGTLFAISLTAGISASPQLAITRSGSNAIISWPYPSTGWTLQTNRTLNTGTWGNYLGAVINNSVTNSPPTGNAFFRLIH